MSKSLYDEAIAEAHLLRETAEKNAKNAIIEAVTPKIREFIEQQLIGEENSQNDEQDVLDDVVNDIVGINEAGAGSVELDETALMSLVGLLGGDDIQNMLSDSKSSISVSDAVRESLSSLDENEKAKLSSIAHKLTQTADFFKSNDIPNDIVFEQESSAMAAKDDILYEIDLEELRGSMQESRRGKRTSDVELARLLREVSLIVDLGDEVELPEDLMPTVSVVEEEEEEVDVEDFESAEEVEVDVEEEGPPLPPLDEVLEIDPRILRSELVRLRRSLSEASGKDLTKLKGIKDAMESSWGGSGSGRAGLKGAYGGTGGGKAGVKGAYGGGKESGDPLKVKLNKLSEAMLKERRNNRSLRNRLNEYRSAVETLREQLTDLNLFNAKLLYVNKLLQNEGITSAKRKSVIQSLDSAKSLREVKLLYKSLVESFKERKPSSLSESNVRRTLGSSSRTVGRSSAPRTESSEVNRWAKLAGIKE